VWMRWAEGQKDEWKAPGLDRAAFLLTSLAAQASGLDKVRIEKQLAEAKERRANVQGASDRRRYLLDFVPGAAAAYSLRKLSNSYHGPVVTVRRSSDNAEASFTAAQIDDGSLLRWVGAGVSAYVKQWWDQSGTRNHLGNTVSASQPTLVSAGSMVLAGGKPAMLFDGTDDNIVLLAGSSSIPASEYLESLFLVQQHDGAPSPEAGNATVFISGFNGTNNRVYAGIGSAYTTGRLGARFGEATAVNTSEVGAVGNSQFLLSATVNATTATMFINGAIAYDAPHTASTTGITGLNVVVGGEAVGGFLNGRQQELIIYVRDMTAQRQQIEGDMARYY
jgi:hypothetical protein